MYFFSFSSAFSLVRFMILVFCSLLLVKDLLYGNSFRNWTIYISVLVSVVTFVWLNHLLQDVIHVVESKPPKRYGDYFLRQIVKVCIFRIVMWVSWFILDGYIVILVQLLYMVLSAAWRRDQWDGWYKAGISCMSSLERTSALVDAPFCHARRILSWGLIVYYFDVEEIVSFLHVILVFIFHLDFI